MRRPIAALALGALMASACDPSLVGLTAQARKAASVVRPDAARSAAPSASPRVEVAPSASPTPRVPTRSVLGVVRIDASYVIAAGGGQVISFGGGNVIAAGGGQVIANGGGNVIANGGGNLRLLQAADVPTGTVLPVQGMAVSAYSLASGEVVAGPVATDAEGGYALAVPESVKDNILVRGTLPAQPSDPRLQYNLLVAPEKADAGVIDEDTSLGTKYLIACFEARLGTYLTGPVEDNVAFYADYLKLTSTLAPAVQDAILANVRVGMEKMSARAKAAGVVSGDARIRRVSERLLGRVDFEAVMNHHPHDPAYPKEPALAAMVAVNKQLRLAVEQKLLAEPGFATNNPTGKPLLKTTDLGDFIVAQSAVPGSEVMIKNVLQSVMESVGLGSEPQNRLLAAAVGFTFATGDLIFSPQNAEALDHALAALGEAPADAAASGTP